MNNPIPNSKIIKDNKIIRVYPTEVGTQSFGRLQIHCVTPNMAPVEGATISISSPSQPAVVIEKLKTDISGLTPVIELPAPSIDYSLAPSEIQPYSDYNIRAEQVDYTPVYVYNMQLLADTTAIQDATMEQVDASSTEYSQFVIQPHTLFGDFPPKIAEPEINPAAETGEIVLRQVVIPEFIVVHDGPPTDTSAANHYVKFRDYIKNVASSEIYATWPESTIQANVLAILSFTLNRVFTEWYGGHHSFVVAGF